MINIILPALSFVIALALIMVMIGFLQREDDDKLSTIYLAMLLAISSALVQVVGYLYSAGYVPIHIFPFVLVVYFIVPFFALFYLKKLSIYKASVFSLVVLASAFFSGAAVAYFINSNS